MFPHSRRGGNPLGGLPCQSLAEQGHAGDGVQRLLRSRFPPRLMPGVGLPYNATHEEHIVFVGQMIRRCSASRKEGTHG